MMAKRQAFQYRAPRAKVPKLDITTSSRQWNPIPGPSKPPDHNRMTATSHQAKQPQQSEDMWGDEDAEFIMLASQAVEKVDAHAEQVISQAMNLHEIDISYGRFRREVEASTQMNKPLAVNDIMNDFMCSNDDEDLFAKLPDYQPVATISKSPIAIPTVNENASERDDVFEMPANQHRITKQNQQKVEKAKIEAQTTFLSNKLRDQKREIENLKENLMKINEKCQTKEGEASTLRYELELNKQQCDRLRKEKMAEVEHLERDYLEKLTNLEKLIESQRSEIQFKNIEILNKKSRRSLNTTMPPPALPSEQHQLAKTEAYNLFRLQSTYFVQKSDLNPIKFSSADVNFDDTMQLLNQKDATILKHLQYLQMIWNQIDQIKQCRPDEIRIKQIFALAAELIFSLQIYSQQLDLSNFVKYNPTVEYKQLSEAVRKQELNKCANEKLIYESRMLSVLALICNRCASLTKVLFDQSARIDSTEIEVITDENECFVDALADILKTIGFAKTQLNLHKSFVEASALLLSALATNYQSNDKRDFALVNLFKAIVLCQPSISALSKLTLFLEWISKQKSTKCCNSLCYGRNNNIIMYPRYNIKRYSPDTCPLQVYASLLEVTFQQYESLHLNTEFLTNINTLAHISIGAMTFLRNCFKRSVDWLFRKSEDGNDNVYICHCYCHIVSCIIVLLHLCIKYWIQEPQSLDLKTIEVLFKMAAIFLQDNFNQHYEPKVLQLGGMPIKNRLQILYDWIVFYQHLFKFGNSHLIAIQSVNLRRITLMNEPQRISTEMQQKSVQQNNDGTDDNSSVLINTFDQFSIKS